MRTYDEALAAARPRRPFSNGTEGYGWMDNWCDQCIHDRGARDGTDDAGCALVRVALMDKTPIEWIDGPRDEHGRYSIEGQYHCIEFRNENDGPGDDPGPEPIPVIPGQLDVFGVFADQVRIANPDCDQPAWWENPPPKGRRDQDFGQLDFFDLGAALAAERNEPRAGDAPPAEPTPPPATPAPITDRSAA